MTKIKWSRSQYYHPLNRNEALQIDRDLQFTKLTSFRASLLQVYGGKLHLTQNEMVFIPHRFNTRSNFKIIIPFNEVDRIWKSGIIQKLVNLKTIDGQMFRFITWYRDMVIDYVGRILSEVAD
jgi:hypothetical protein